MRFLRSNTAVIVQVGPFYDKTDGVTIETALTITNERITLTADTDGGSAPTNILDNIAGATSGTANDLNYITGNDAGMMQIELAAADVNRVGRMALSITDAANHVPVFHDFFVLPQAIFDWLTGVIVPLPANVTQLLGTAWLTPGTAGTPDVNAKLWNGLTTVALPLIPTTAGRTLDVTATGEAGIDWANVGAPTTTLNLSGTTIKTATDVATATTSIQADTDDIQTRIPAALVSGRMDSSVGAMAANVLTAAAINADAITAAKVADGTIDAATFAAGAINAAAIASNAITSAKVATDAIGAAQLAADAATEIVTAMFARAFSAAYGSLTFDQIVSVLAAGMAGKLSGAATTTVSIRNLADNADVIVATVDASGNRSAVTLTP